MLRKQFFLFVICPFYLTKCACCHGFSDNCLQPSSKACSSRLLNVCSNKVSSLFLWMWLLKPPSTPADRSNLKAFKDEPEETLLAQILYSHCPLHYATGKSTYRPPKGECPFETLCGHAHSCLRRMHSHPIFLRRPTKYSKGTWHLRALGLQSSPCIYFMHCATLNIWPSVSSSVKRQRQGLLC